MTILSDLTIDSLCRLPEQVIDKDLLYRLLQQNPLTIPAVHYPNPEHRPDFEGDHRRKYEAQAMRPPTQEEIDAFVPMISPFTPHQVRKVDRREVRGGELVVEERKVISKGLSPSGYDVSLSSELKLFSNINSSIIDPKKLDDRCLVDANVIDSPDGARYVLLPPNSYLLGRTEETFDLPSDITGMVLTKSTYARSGVMVNTTILQPGFTGQVVLEIANGSNLPVKIYINEGLAIAIFFRNDKPSTAPYAGGYQGQTGVRLPGV